MRIALRKGASGVSLLNMSKCVMCKSKEVTDEMRYQNKYGNRITIDVCSSCMAKDLMKELKNFVRK